jgi:hypothetical protein
LVINPFELELLASKTNFGSLAKTPVNLVFVRLGLRLDPEAKLLLDETK